MAGGGGQQLPPGVIKLLNSKVNIKVKKGVLDNILSRVRQNQSKPKPTVTQSTASSVKKPKTQKKQGIRQGKSHIFMKHVAMGPRMEVEIERKVPPQQTRPRPRQPKDKNLDSLPSYSGAGTAPADSYLADSVTGRPAKISYIKWICKKTYEKVRRHLCSESNHSEEDKNEINFNLLAERHYIPIYRWGPVLGAGVGRRSAAGLGAAAAPARRGPGPGWRVRRAARRGGLL